MGIHSATNSDGIFNTVVGYMGISAAKNVQQDYEEVVGVNQKMVILVWKIRAAQMEKEADIRAFMLYKEPKYMEDYDALDKEQIQAFSEIESLDKSPQTTKYLADLRQSDVKYDEGVQEIAKAVKADKLPLAIMIATTVKGVAGDFKTLSNEWENAVTKV